MKHLNANTMRFNELKSRDHFEVKLESMECRQNYIHNIH